MRLEPKENRQLRTRAWWLVMAVAGGAISVASAWVAAMGLPGKADTAANSPGVSKALSAIVTQCEQGNTTACKELEAAKVASTGDLDQAVTLIEQASAGDPNYAAQCHTVAHYIGRIAYHQRGIGTSLAQMPGICRGGILHGAQEEWSDDKDLDEIRTQAPAVCQSLSELGIGAVDTCHHGIGHVFEYEFGHWQPAAQACMETLGNQGGGACLAGSVMSWVDKLNSDGSLGEPLEQVELLNGCSAFTGPGLPACAQSAGYAMMHAAGWDPVEAAQGCAQADQVNVASECAVGLGLEVGYLQVANPRGAAVVCARLGQDHLTDPCLAGAALRVVQNVMDVGLARDICDSQGPRGLYCERTLQDAERISISMRELESQSRN